MLYEGLENFKSYLEGTDFYKNFYGAGICYEGDYLGRHFAICRNEFGEPTAYVEILDNDYIAKEAKKGLYKDPYDIYEGDVHGEMTYYGSAWWDKSDKKTYLGWDYGHCYDYKPARGKWPAEDGYKWRPVEVLLEIARVMVQIEMQNSQHENDKN